MSRIFFVLFLFLGFLFIFSSILKKELLLGISSFLLMPTLFLYYYRRSSRMSLCLIIVFVAFYARDLFLYFGFHNFPVGALFSFFMGIFFLLLFAIAEIKKTRLFFIEGMSLVIMYSFLCFLFFSMSETVPQVTPGFEVSMYFYLLSLVLFLAISFTAYMLKPHIASLWIMLAASCYIFSEISLFFKLFLLDEISVSIFYPVFHVCAYFAVVQYALHRRKSTSLPFL